MQPRTNYTTKAGTVLPIINLKGKEYLEVKYRLVWFREEHPEWSIETEFVERTQDGALAKATIKNDKGQIMATSHKFEDKKGFFDFMEKAETGSIGRALALMGYGTQFCADELDEADRIVDAPVQKQVEKQAPGPAPKAPPNAAPISMNQVKELFEIAAAVKVKPDDLFAYVKTKYGVERSQDIKQFQFEEIKEYLKNAKT